MHVHGPSEHTVNGIYFPVEIHLVHLPEGVSAADGPTKALVLGIFLTAGKANSFFNVLTALAADGGTSPVRRRLSGGEEVHMFKAVTLYSLIPNDKSYWHYTGSLTAIGYGGCQLNNASPNFDPDENNI